MSPLTADGLQPTQAPSVFCSSGWVRLSSTCISIYLYVQREDAQNSISHPALPAACLLLPLTLLNLRWPRQSHPKESSRLQKRPGSRSTPHTDSRDDMGLYLAQPKCKHKTCPGDESGPEAWTWRGDHAQGTHRHLEKPGPCPRGQWLLAEGMGDTSNISSYQGKI